MNERVENKSVSLLLLPIPSFPLILATVSLTCGSDGSHPSVFLRVEAKMWQAVRAKTRVVRAKCGTAEPGAGAQGDDVQTDEPREAEADTSRRTPRVSDARSTTSLPTPQRRRRAPRQRPLPQHEPHSLLEPIRRSKSVSAFLRSGFGTRF